MSIHYEQRMEADLDEIHRKLQRISTVVEGQVARALEAFFEQDRGAASAVVLADRDVNRGIGNIDRLCHAFIVRYAPSEVYLRRVSAVLRLDVALERVGDYAASIAREVARVSAPPPEGVEEGIREIAGIAQSALADALAVFHAADADRARQPVAIPDARVERVFAALLGVGQEETRPLPDVFGYMHVLNLLLRVTEQSDNIREQTLFAISGRTQEPRAFRVLFVDAHNDRASLMAEAYARAKFPERGRYRSAGWSPAAGLDPSFVTFMAGKGLDVSDARPIRLDAARAEEDREHVVVLMGPGGRDHLAPLPFRTTLVTWDLAGAGEDGLDDLYEEVGGRVDDLMTTLAGPEAA